MQDFVHTHTRQSVDPQSPKLGSCEAGVIALYCPQAQQPSLALEQLDKGGTLWYSY